jgi:hypothetical protein
MSYFRVNKSAMVSSKNISENFLVNSLLSSMGFSLPLRLLRILNRPFV